MANSFGGSVKLKGESEYRKALNQINDTYKLLNSEMKAVTSAFDKNDKSVENLSAQNEVLTKKIREQTDKVELLKKALQDAKDETGENSATSKKWETQLNNAQAQLNSLNLQLENNKRDMAAAENATDEETDAVRDLGKEADSTGSKMNNFGKALGGAIKAAMTAAAAVGTAAVAAGKKIADMAKSTAEAGDEIDKQSQKLGLSAEKYQELSYAMKRSGADIESFKKGTVNISKAIADVQNGVAGAGATFNKLGVSLQNSDGSMRSTENVLLDTIDALADVQDEVQRNVIANEIFGKSYTELAPLLNSGSEGIRELMNEAEQYGMVMSDDAVKASVAFQDSLTKLNGTITGAKNRLMGELLPGMSAVMNGLSDLISGTGKGSEKIKEGVNSIVGTISDDLIPKAFEFLETISSTILENAPTLIQSLADGVIGILPDVLSVALTDVLPNLVNVTVSITGSLLSSLASALPQLMITLSTTIVDLLNNLLTPENIQNAVNILIRFITSIVYGLKESLPILIEGATKLISGLVAALPDVINQLLDALPMVISMIFSPEGGLLSRDNIMSLIKGAADIVLQIAINLPTIIMSLLDALPVIIDALFDQENGFLAPQNIQQLLDSAKDVCKRIILALPGILKNLLLTLPNIVDTILGAFGGLIDSFFGLGEGAGESFLRGFAKSLAIMGGVSADAANMAFGTKQERSAQFEKMMKNYYNIDANVTFNSDGSMSVIRDEDIDNISNALAEHIREKNGAYY